MSQTSPELLKRLRGDQNALFYGIVAVTGDPARHVKEAQALGLTLNRVLTLIPSLALSGPARAFLALNEREWVLNIEEDRRVTAV